MTTLQHGAFGAHHEDRRRHPEIPRRTGISRNESQVVPALQVLRSGMGVRVAMHVCMPGPADALTRGGDLIPPPPSPSTLPAAESERRERSGRRHDTTPGRRGDRAAITKRRVLALLGDVAAIVVLVAAIVFAVNHERPIFAGQPSVAQSLAERVPLTKPLLAPATAAPGTGRLAALMASPQFATDSAAFAADLVRTGRMSQERADTIAFYAVQS